MRLKVLAILIAIAFASASASAEDFFARKLEEKNGAILLIVDGMGASYLSTYNYTPLDLNGKPLTKAATPNLSSIAGKGVLVQDVRALLPNTQRGHSIIVTGYSNADLEMLDYSDASIYDVLRSHGYLCIAVMEKGDFDNIIREQDVVIHDRSNSLDNPAAELDKSAEVQPDIERFMLNLTEKLPSFVEGKNGIEKYSQYNRWAIDSGSSIASYMAKNYPDKKFFLTINAGGTDMVGHAYNAERCVNVIERLDELLPALYETCSRNNLSLIITADHGMKFPSATAKGGHSSEKYSSALESQRIPLIMYSPGIEGKVIAEVREQKDLAPTILSLLDIVELPAFADGKAIPLRGYINLKVKADEPADIRILRGQEVVARTFAGNATFYGLDPGNYTLLVDGESKQVNLASDEIIAFLKKDIPAEPVYRNSQVLAGGVILSIITLGLLMIRRIARK